jgi:ABC-type Fe3+/spermidine/putrescine transport system ATPase subunit
MPLLQVSHLSKTFDGKSTLNDVSFEVEAGDIVCLLGPSGCGKTTLLRIIAGLETADSGMITFDGQDVQNIPDQIQSLGRSALDRVGLSGFAQRNVHQLSGGERQRVALARSLAPQPKLLMLDEPLGALDRQLREELMIELRRILKAAHLTSIYVTHDQAEAFAVADRVAVMNAGRIEQLDTPSAVYARPVSEFVARFLGMPNVIEGTVLSVAAQVAVVNTPIGLLHVTADHALHPDQPVTLLIRSEAATIEPDPFAASADEWFAETPQADVLRGVVREISFRGRTQRIVIRWNDLDFEFEVDAHTALPPLGHPVKISLPADAIHVI